MKNGAEDCKVLGSYHHGPSWTSLGQLTDFLYMREEYICISFKPLLSWVFPFCAAQMRVRWLTCTSLHLKILPQIPEGWMNDVHFTECWRRMLYCKSHEFLKSPLKHFCSFFKILFPTAAVSSLFILSLPPNPLSLISPSLPQPTLKVSST